MSERLILTGAQTAGIVSTLITINAMHSPTDIRQVEGKEVILTVYAFTMAIYEIAPDGTVTEIKEVP